MANNSLQSAVSNADAYLVSSKQFRRILHSNSIWRGARGKDPSKAIFDSLPLLPVISWSQGGKKEDEQ